MWLLIPDPHLKAGASTWSQHAAAFSLPWPTFLKDVHYSPNCTPGGRLYYVKATRYGMLPGGGPEAY